MIISTSTAAPSDMALLTQGVDVLSTRETAIQAALSSGVLSDSYGGLGDQAYQALSLQPEITKVTGWQTNITSAQGTLDVTQTAMSQITTIATNLQTSLTSLQGDKSATSVQAAATEARDELTQLASILNTKNGSQYVFSGNASDDPPVTDPSNITSSTFFQSIATSVAAVGTLGASAVESANLLAASSNTAGQSVFSNALSVSGDAATSLIRRVTVGDQDHVSIGFVATQGSVSTSASTGSPIRDLMQALATVGTLDQADASTSGFDALVGDTSTRVGAITSSLNLTVASLGQTQVQLTDQASSLGLTSDALTKQLGLVKDSDPAALSTQLTDTQNQLQASYSLISDMKGMSLAAYL